MLGTGPFDVIQTSYQPWEGGVSRVIPVLDMKRVRLRARLNSLFQVTQVASGPAGIWTNFVHLLRLSSAFFGHKAYVLIYLQSLTSWFSSELNKRDVRIEVIPLVILHLNEPKLLI